MPVALHRSGVDHVTRADLQLFVRGADPTLSLEDVQHLLARMDMPVRARSVFKANEAHGHAAGLLRSQEPIQLGLARERVDLLLLRLGTAHDLHRSPSFIAAPSHSMTAGCGNSIAIPSRPSVLTARLIYFTFTPSRCHKTASYAGL